MRNWQNEVRLQKKVSSISRKSFSENSHTSPFAKFMHKPRQAQSSVEEKSPESTYNYPLKDDALFGKCSSRRATSKNS